MRLPQLFRRRRPPQAAARRAVRPTLEGLEGRQLLYATTGDMWVNPVRVTYSIVPDGTSIGGVPSNLQATMNAKFSTASWQLAIQKAAAVWESVANVNLVQVPDNGAPIGTSGDQQGDSRFGDIRIGGFAQSSGTLAFAYLPPPANGGTDAGDIFFNTAQSWSISGQTYDLETVAIHELGHALGMEHSAIVQADMYANYQGSTSWVNADDTSGIDSIYNARCGGGNNSAKGATVITGSINSLNQISLSGLAIASASDSDWYYVTVPSGTTGTMTVTMQSSNLSSLCPRVIVYNSAQTGLAQASSTNFGATVTVSISGVTAGQGYYIKGLSAVSGAGSAGAYGLQVNFGSATMSPIAPPNTTVAAAADQGGGTAAMSVNNGNGVNESDTVTVGTVSGVGDLLTVSDDGRHDHYAAHNTAPPPSPGAAGPLPLGSTTYLVTANNGQLQAISSSQIAANQEIAAAANGALYLVNTNNAYDIVATPDGSVHVIQDSKLDGGGLRVAEDQDGSVHVVNPNDADKGGLSVLLGPDGTPVIVQAGSGGTTQVVANVAGLHVLEFLDGSLHVYRAQDMDKDPHNLIVTDDDGSLHVANVGDLDPGGLQVVLGAGGAVVILDQHGNPKQLAWDSNGLLFVIG